MNYYYSVLSFLTIPNFIAEFLMRLTEWDEDVKDTIHVIVVVIYLFFPAIIFLFLEGISLDDPILYVGILFVIAVVGSFIYVLEDIRDIYNDIIDLILSVTDR